MEPAVASRQLFVPDDSGSDAVSKCIYSVASPLTGSSGGVYIHPLPVNCSAILELIPVVIAAGANLEPPVGLACQR